MRASGPLKLRVDSGWRRAEAESEDAGLSLQAEGEDEGSAPAQGYGPAGGYGLI